MQPEGAGSPDHPAPGPAASSPPGRFEGRQAFQTGVRAMFSRAADTGWRDMLWCDPDFADWPLGERAVVEGLQRWARPGRRLMLLAAGYREMERFHARFVHWRRQWDILIDARQAPRADASGMPSLLLGGDRVLHRLDMERCRGWVSDDPAVRLRLKEQVEDLRRRSAPAFPATTLGL